MEAKNPYAIKFRDSILEKSTLTVGDSLTKQRQNYPASPQNTLKMLEDVRRIGESYLEFQYWGNDKSSLIIDEIISLKETPNQQTKEAALEHHIPMRWQERNYDTLEFEDKNNHKDLRKLRFAGENPLGELEKRFGVGADKAQGHWKKSAVEILQQFNLLAVAAKEKGYDIQRFISEGSPGPSQRTRDNWKKTAESIKKQFEYIRAESQIAGSDIEQAFAANPDLLNSLNTMEARLDSFTSSLDNDYQFDVAFETDVIDESAIEDSLQAITSNLSDIEIGQSLTFSGDDATAGFTTLQDALAHIHGQSLDLQHLWQQLVQTAGGFADNLGQGNDDPLGGLEDVYDGYTDAVNRLPNTEDIFGGISDFIDRMSESSPVFGKVVGFFNDLGVAALGILGFSELSDVITDGFIELVNYGREFQRFDRAMSAAGKSGKQVFEDLYVTSQKYGTSLTESMAGYTQLSLSTQGTDKESVVDSIFPGFQKAFASRQATPDQQGRGFLAVEQMLSKGNASAEELRQQLSEALPGAFSIAAQAMGMDMQEFTVKLYTAQIASEELLTRMAAFYDADSAILLQISSASFEAELNRLTNNLDYVKSVAGGIVVPLLTPSLQAANAVLTLVGQNAELVSVIFSGLLAGAIWKTVAAMLGVSEATGLNIVLMKLLGIETNTMSASMIASLTKVQKAQLLVGRGIKGVIAGAKAMWKAFAAPTAVMAGLYLAIKLIGAGAEEVKAAAKVAKSISEETKSEDDKRKSFAADTALGRVGQNTKEIFTTPEGFLKNLIAPLEWIDTRASKVDKRGIEKSLKYSGETGQNIADIIKSTDFSRVKEQIDKNRADQSVLNAQRRVAIANSDYGQLEEVELERARLKKQQENALKPIAGNIVTVNKDIEQLNSQKDYLDKGFDKENITQKEYERLTKEIDAKIEFQIKNKNVLEALLKGVTTDIAAEFINIQEDFDNTAWQISGELTQSSIDNINAKLNGEISSLELEVLTSFDAKETAAKNLQNASKQADAQKEAILGKSAGLKKAALFDLKLVEEADFEDGSDSYDFDAVFKSKLGEILNLSPDKFIKPTAEDASESDLALSSFLSSLGDYSQVADNAAVATKESNSATNDYISQLKDNAAQHRDFAISLRDFSRSIEDVQIERQRFAEDFPLQVAQVNRDIERSARDLAEQYDDFILGLDKQIIETELQILDLARQLENTQLNNKFTSALSGTQGLGRELAELYLQYAESVQSDEEIALQLDLDKLSVEEQVLQNARQIRDIAEQRRDFEIDRLQQMRDLNRQQEDFNLQQKRTWEDNLEQWYGIGLQSQELGITLSQTGEQVAQQGTGLVESIHYLSESIIAKATELRHSASNADLNPATNVPKGDRFVRAAKILRKEEGFRNNAYWDVNAWRVGYGTEFNKSKPNSYTKDSWISREGAEKQLMQYDLPKFEKVIMKQMGKQYWNALNANVQAALLSVAYNRGSLTKGLIAASRTGNAQTIASQIRRTDASTHQKRRNNEAALALSKENINHQPEVKAKDQPQYKPVEMTKISMPNLTAPKPIVSSHKPIKDRSVEAKEKTAKLNQSLEEKYQIQKQLTPEQKLQKKLDFIDQFQLKSQEIQDYFVQQNRSAELTQYEGEKRTANAKGYLTANEEIDFAGRDVANQYRQEIDGYREAIKDLERTKEGATKSLGLFKVDAENGNELAQKMVEEQQNIIDNANLAIAQNENAKINVEVEMDFAINAGKTNKALEIEFQKRADELGMKDELLQIRLNASPDFIGQQSYNKEARDIGKERIGLEYDEALKKIEKYSYKKEHLIEQQEKLREAVKKTEIGSKYEKAVKKLANFEAKNKSVFEQQEKLNQALKNATTGEQYVKARKDLMAFNKRQEELLATQKNLEAAAKKETDTDSYTEATTKLDNFTTKNKSLIDTYRELKEAAKEAGIGFEYHDAAKALEKFIEQNKRLVLQYEKLIKAQNEAKTENEYKEATGDLEAFNKEHGKTIEDWNKHKDAIEEVNQAKLDQLYRETSTLHNLLKDNVMPAFDGLLDDFIDDSVTAKEAWENFAVSLLNSFADILMAYAQNEILKMLFKAPDKKEQEESTGGQTQSQSSNIASDLINGAFNIGSAAISNSQQASAPAQQQQPEWWQSALAYGAQAIPLFFREGGDTASMFIPNASMGLDTDDIMMAKGLKEAMRREAHSEAFPAVLHKGEVVLTDLNGDAQLAREMMTSGEWEQMKNPTYQPARVDNFRNGSESYTASTRRGNGQTTVVNNSPITVYANDANSFKLTDTQIAYRQKLQMERSKR